MFQISSAIRVSLPKEEVVYLDTRVIDGKQFFCANKKDRKFERLLMAASTKREGEHRPLSKTSIVEGIAKMRDELVWKDIGMPPPGARQNRHYSKTQLMQLLALEDTASAMIVPGMGEVKSCSVTVLKTKPGSSLWVEATVATFEFLSNIVAHERECATTHRTRQSQLATSSCVGVSTVKDGGYRARKRTQDGTIKNKFFKVQKFDDEDGARDAAQDFVNGMSEDNGDVADEGEEQPEEQPELCDDRDGPSDVEGSASAM